jgi:hypothetical protein
MIGEIALAIEMGAGTALTPTQKSPIHIKWIGLFPP